jgi:hypothetical protein
LTRASLPSRLIGVAELVDIPTWHIRRLRAKVDTGARTSALHVENIREVAHGRVRFDVRLHRHHVNRRVTVETPIRRRGRVRSSNGILEWRIFVEVTVRIGPVERPIELSLVDRRDMLYRMLLGRTALAHEFLVDVSRSYILSASLRRRGLGGWI